MAAQETRISLGQFGYWQRGNSARIRGHRGFERANLSSVKKYIRQVQKVYRAALVKDLPNALQSFISSQLHEGNMPWDTGNLHDSIAGAIVYKNDGGANVLGRTVIAKPVAREKQKWGLSLGGIERDQEIRAYTGFGKHYAESFRDDASRSLHSADAARYDLQIYLEATIPYALPLEYQSGFNYHWFTDLSGIFADYIRVRTGIIVDQTNKKAIFNEGFTEWGVQAEIGF